MLKFFSGMTEGTRTLDILIDNQALFQLSYDRVVKPAGIEPALPDRGSGVLPLDDGSLAGQPGVEPEHPV